MNRILRIEPLAEEDILRAHDWYSKQRSEVGDRFVSAADHCFLRITTSPMQFPCVHKLVRRALLRGFKYCVYFLVTDDEIIVLAVLHGRRNPDVWRQRVS